MAFPGRAYLYDHKQDEWIPPEDSAPYLLTADGVPTYAKCHPRQSGPSPATWIGVEDRFTVCWSTGLKDEKGKEIIEGHILKPDRDPTLKGEIYLVTWVQSVCQFALYPSTYTLSVNRSVVIQGHALIHHDLVPDGFDPSEYFDREAV